MIIAEAGTAWGGGDLVTRINSLLEHIQKASVAGADIFKVQMFAREEPLFCPMLGDNIRSLWWGECLLPLETWAAIKDNCEAHGMEFMASAFQPTAVDWLNQLGVKRFKVASRAVEAFPYEKAKGEFIVSNGMGMKWPDVPHKKLMCVSKYPTPLSDAGWAPSVIHGAGFMWNADGLSDHSGTPWPAIDALARGAEIVEVHFKTEYSRGPDLASSVTVDELKMICDFQKALKEMRG